MYCSKNGVVAGSDLKNNVIVEGRVLKSTVKFNKITTIYGGLADNHWVYPNNRYAKYILTEETKQFNNHILHRVQYKDGKLGGWIESEFNLQGNAKVLDEAIVYGNSVVRDKATVKDKSIIGGNSLITDSAIVLGKSFVSNSTVSNSYIDNSKILAYSIITDTDVYSDSIVGNARIKCSDIVKSDIRNSDIVKVTMENSKVTSSWLCNGGEKSVLDSKLEKSKLYGNCTIKKCDYKYVKLD